MTSVCQCDCSYDVNHLVDQVRDLEHDLRLEIEDLQVELRQLRAATAAFRSRLELKEMSA